MTQKEAVRRVTQLALPLCGEAGVSLWDVTFEKEGRQHVLTVYIDKEPAVDISDCERVSRALDPLLDAPEFDDDYPSVDSFLHKYDEKVNELHTLARNLMQFIAPGAPETGAASAAQTAAPAQAGGASSTVEELKQYKALLDAGVITEEEFAAKKRQLLGI